MSNGADPTRQRIALAVVLVAVLIVVVVWQFGGESLSSVGGRGKEIAYDGHEVPTLHLARITPLPEDLSSSGRNPFTFGAPPTPTPNLTPPPTLPPRPATPTPRPTRPRPTPVDEHGGLGPPPEFERRYIGYLGPDHTPVAVFRTQVEDNDVIEVAMLGEVIDGTFIVCDIGLESVEIGFIGYPEEVTTRVPLAE
jgi:hypothetical protein